MKWSDLIKGDHWLVSPRLSEWQKKILLNLRERSPKTGDSIWILSSGTQSARSVKAIALSNDRILKSAESVNRHLLVTAKDRWLVAIPSYHIGGLSIWARAHLSGSSVEVFDENWSPQGFATFVKKKWVTLSSLVPTQVHDLVAAKLESPPSLRAIVVGGGALDPELYAKARKLRWPLLPSYGLTECCSQVATASMHSLSSPGFPDFEILPHVEAKISERRIFLKSESLCRWVAVGFEDGAYTLEDPLRDGWYGTEDLGDVHANQLKILGRRDEIVKVLGVLVSVPAVEAAARAFFAAQNLKGDLAVLAIPDEREAHKLVLFTDSKNPLTEWEHWVHRFNSIQPGPERLQQIVWLDSIPRSELGKILKGELHKKVPGSEM